MTEVVFDDPRTWPIGRKITDDSGNTLKTVSRNQTGLFLRTQFSWLDVRENITFHVCWDYLAEHYGLLQ